MAPGTGRAHVSYGTDVPVAPGSGASAASLTKVSTVHFGPVDACAMNAADDTDMK